MNIIRLCFDWSTPCLGIFSNPNKNEVYVSGVDFFFLMSMFGCRRHLKGCAQQSLDVLIIVSTMKFLSASVLLLLASSADAFGVSKFSFGATTRTSSSLTQLYAEGSKITMPALSSTMKEGKVVSWLKSEGEPIEAGEAIMVVESDKADMDVEAFEDGFLAKIIVNEGEMAPVGEAVALIASEESEIDAVIASFSGGAATSAPAPAVEEAAPAAPSGGE